MRLLVFWPKKDLKKTTMPDEIDTSLINIYY